MCLEDIEGGVVVVAKKAATGGMMTRLLTESFYGLVEELAEWRRDPQIRLMDAERDEGRILGFVKGLRLSARVAYLSRELLASDRSVEVSWGHLIDPNEGKSCSAECDVIIHRGGCLKQWNGKNNNCIMDFKFIDSSKALGVISCKSFAKSVDKSFCTNLAKYNVKNVILFAECCLPNKVADLEKEALANGYSGFTYLYTFEETSFSIETNQEVYLRFAEQLKAMASGSARAVSATPPRTIVRKRSLPKSLPKNASSGKKRQSNASRSVKKPKPAARKSVR